MLKTCSVCGRHSQADSELCEIHMKASENLDQAYEAWLKAFGGSLDLDEFLRHIMRLPETGQEVKELARRKLGLRRG